MIHLKENNDSSHTIRRKWTDLECWFVKNFTLLFWSKSKLEIIYFVN